MFSTIINRIMKHARLIGMALLVVLTLGFYSPADYEQRVRVEVVVPEPHIVEVPCCHKDQITNAPIQPKESEANPFDFLKDSKSAPKARFDHIEEGRQPEPSLASKLIIGGRQTNAPSAPEYRRVSTDSVYQTNHSSSQGLYNTHPELEVFRDGTMFQMEHSRFRPRILLEPQNVALEGFQRGVYDRYLLTGVSIEDHPLNDEQTVRLDLPRDHPYYGMAQGRIWEALIYPEKRPGQKGDYRYANYGILSPGESLG